MAASLIKLITRNLNGGFKMLKYLHSPNKGKLRVLGYSSGSGNSLWKVLELQKQLENTFEGCPFEIVGLFSDNPNSKAIAYANHIGLPCASLDLREFHQSRNMPLSNMQTRAEFDKEVYELIKPFNADMILLAGYVWATTDIIVDNFIMINVHPADLSVNIDGRRPYAGANGVGDTLSAGEATISSSAHIATKDIDGGPLLFLSPKVEINYSLYNNMEDLKKHYLKIVNEHSRLLSARTILEISEGNIALNEEGIVCYKGEPMPNGIRINSWSENMSKHERHIDRVIAPKSIAIIGASAKGGLGKSILDNIIKTEFKGSVFAVNRKGEEVSSIAAYKSVLDIPSEIDLAVITLPSAAVLEVVNECGIKGIKALVCITAGFKETGTLGAKNEEKLKALLDKYNMRMLGPNCMGVLNTDSEINLNATMLQHSPRRGNVAFVTQSGALGAALLDYAEELGLGFSIIASLGNQADINVNDMLPLLAEDKNTDVIMLYMEALIEPHRFLKLAEKISKTKPIIVIKSGKTEAGAKAASSHTGSIAGADTAVSALFEKAGVIRVETLEDAYYLSLALSKMPRMKGKRVGVVTNAGGPGILLADSLSTNGFELPLLSEAARENLADRLLPEASTGNPIDLVAAAPPEHYAFSVETMLNSGQYDAVLMVCVPPATIDTGAVAKAISQPISNASVPVLCCFLGPTLGKAARTVLKEVNIPYVEYPEKLASILKYMKIDASILGTGSNISQKFDMSGNSPLSLKHKANSILRLCKPGEYLSTEDSFNILSCYGFDLPRYRFIKSIGEISDINLNFPLVAKIEHRDIIHKSDVGGVVLGIKDLSELSTAVSVLLEKFPGAKGVLLQEQSKFNSEIILGGKLEPGIGQIALVGLGGTSVEIYKDVSIGFVPVSFNEAERMIQNLKCFPLLKGYRGKAGVDLAKLREQLLRLNQILFDLPQISEIDLNPVVYDESEHSFKILDCRIKI